MKDRILNIALTVIGVLLIAICGWFVKRIDDIDGRTREMDKVLTKLLVLFEYQHGSDAVEAFKITDDKVRVAE